MTQGNYCLKLLVLFVTLVLMPACAHKKANQLTKKDLTNKTVALAQIKASHEIKKQVEVSIINEIIDNGRFNIVEKDRVQEELVHFPAESDWQRLGKKLGADYILSLDVLQHDIQDYQGYDKKEEEDSVMTEEHRAKKPIKATKYVKVKALEGKVRIRFTFFDVAKDEIKLQTIGEAEQTLSSRDQSLPRKMKLLEDLTSKAISDFFAKLE